MKLLGKKTRALFKTKFVSPFENIEEQLKKEGKWSGEVCHETKSGREVVNSKLLAGKV